MGCIHVECFCWRWFDPLHDLQVPTFTSTLATHNEIEPSPSAWRAGLRKTGSTSAVSEVTHNLDKEKEKLARSASSPWLAPEHRISEVSAPPIPWTWDPSNLRRFSDVSFAIQALCVPLTTCVIMVVVQHVVRTSTQNSVRILEHGVGHLFRDRDSRAFNAVSRLYSAVWQGCSFVFMKICLFSSDRLYKRCLKAMSDNCNFGSRHDLCKLWKSLTCTCKLTLMQVKCNLALWYSLGCWTQWT